MNCQSQPLWWAFTFTELTVKHLVSFKGPEVNFISSVFFRLFFPVTGAESNALRSFLNDLFTFHMAVKVTVFVLSRNCLFFLEGSLSFSFSSFQQSSRFLVVISSESPLSIRYGNIWTTCLNNPEGNTERLSKEAPDCLLRSVHLQPYTSTGF